MGYGWLLMRPSDKPGPEIEMRIIGSMERRGFLKQSLSAVALGAAAGCTQGEPPDGLAGPADPAQLHQKAIVIDTYGKLYLEEFQKGHVDAIVHGIGVEEIFRSDARKGIIDPPQVGKNICDNLFDGPDVVKRVLQRVDEILEQSVRRHPDSVELALRSSDVKQIARTGKIAVIPMLNAGWIDNDLAVLRMYHRMGIRVFALTPIAAFDWVDSSGELNPKTGLSDFGREVVRECNRIGMLVDVSHASDQAFWDTIRTSSRPIIATHSGCRALCYVQRNLTDEMLRALADNGGVVGIFTVPSYLDTKALNDMMKTRFLPDYTDRDLRLARQYSDPWEIADAMRNTLDSHSYTEEIDLPPIDAFLDHIDHAVQVAGIDHVAVSSDNEPGEGLEDRSQWPNLTRGLVKRGYGERDIRKILGENFLRVWDQAAGV